MSDDSQTIVDLEASAKDAKRLGKRVLEHLFEREIVERQQRDCVLGSNRGFPPGSQYKSICKSPSGSDLMDLEVNGLELVCERTVFDATENGLEVRCDYCDIRINEPDDDWLQAVGKWFDGKDSVAYRCPSCSRATKLKDWDGSWPWAFGVLGFRFWNWPTLKKSFVDDVARVLGHRVRVIKGRV